MKTTYHSYTDQKVLDILTSNFFEVFNNKDGKLPKVQELREMFVNDGIIINNTEDEPQIYNLENFIAPREQILTDGTLTEFNEYEKSNDTRIFKTIAHRFSSYKKSGILNGEPFEVEGMKTFQFIKINHIWKIASVVWCDLK